MQDLRTSPGVINPFKGLFYSLQNTIRSGNIVTCSIQKAGAASEEQTAEGLLCGHEYGVMGLYELTDSKGEVHRLIKIVNPHGHGEWNGRYSDGDDVWNDSVLKGHRRDTLGMEAGIVDDGLMMMPFDDFRQEFTKCDISDSCLGSDDNSIFVKQVTGMITEMSCRGGAEWHCNPKFSICLENKTKVTITLNQPNTKIVGYDEYYETKMGFRIIMVLKTDHVSTSTRRESVDQAKGGDCAVTTELSLVTVPSKVSNLNEVRLRFLYTCYINPRPHYT